MVNKNILQCIVHIIQSLEYQWGGDMWEEYENTEWNIRLNRDDVIWCTMPIVRECVKKTTLNGHVLNICILKGLRLFFFLLSKSYVLEHSEFIDMHIEK